MFMRFFCTHDFHETIGNDTGEKISRVRRQSTRSDIAELRTAMRFFA